MTAGLNSGEAGLNSGPGGRLAERYEPLLEASPERYRVQRGEEILGTVLESARPGQRWPSAREAAALPAGGVRTRLAHRSPSYRAWWYGVVHLVVLLLLGLFDLRVPAEAALYLLGSGAFTVAVGALAADGLAVGVAWNPVATLVSALLLAGASLLGQRMVVRL